MDDKSRIAEVRVNPGTAFPADISDDIVYILEDQIGSSVVRLNTSGTVIDEEEYYPFGDSSLRTFIYKRYRYVGKERDAESGLYYYGARYYAAWTCRFISVDPLAKKYAQLSPYNYADNNPINDYDIDGMQNTKSQGGPTNGNTTPANNNTSTSGGSLIHANADVFKFNEKPDESIPANTKPLSPTDNTGIDYKKFELPKDNTIIDFTKIKPRTQEQLYGPNNPEYWELKGNPEMAKFVMTKNVAEKANKGMAVMIWTGYVLDQVGTYGSLVVAAPPVKVEVPKLPVFLLKPNYSTKPLKGLDNPFKNSTLAEIDQGFQNHVESGKLILKYENPKTGAKSYQNTKSGYSYNLDPGGVYGKKVEGPHIDVNYPNPKPLNVDSKKKLQVAGGF